MTPPRLPDPEPVAFVRALKPMDRSRDEALILQAYDDLAARYVRACVEIETLRHLGHSDGLDDADDRLYELGVAPLEPEMRRFARDVARATDAGAPPSDTEPG